MPTESGKKLLNISFIQDANVNCFFYFKEFTCNVNRILYICQVSYLLTIHIFCTVCKPICHGKFVFFE